MGSYSRAAVALAGIPYLFFHLVKWFFGLPTGQELERMLLDRSPVDFVRYGISVEGADSVMAAIAAVSTWWLSWMCYKGTSTGAEYSRRFGLVAAQLVLVPLAIFWLGTRYLGMRQELVLLVIIASIGTIGIFVYKQLTGSSPLKGWRRDG